MVTLDAVELGNVHDLILEIRSSAFAWYEAALDEPIPVLSGRLQVPTLIRVTMDLSDYTGANLRAITGGAGSGGTVEIMADLDQEYEIVFDGLNCLADPPSAFDFVGYRFVPDYNSDLPLISPGRGKAPLAGLLLADPAKSGAGISQYGKFTIA
ncbi:MAG: hypothetical protein GY788_07500 [bacterium]|nr:hypothetical protein [bacterium]